MRPGPLYRIRLHRRVHTPMDTLPFPLQQTSRPNTGDVVSPWFNQDSDDELARWVQKKFSYFKSCRERFERNWNRYFDLYLGAHWANFRWSGDSNWRSQLTINYTRSIIQSLVAVAMDNDPKITIMPNHPYQAFYAGNLQTRIDSIFERRDVSPEIRDAFTNACIYGTGFLFLAWDPTLDNGLGDVKVWEMPTEACYPQPGARRISEMSQFFIRRQESYEWLEEFYPDKAEMCRQSTQDDYNRERKARSQNLAMGGAVTLEGPLSGGYGFAGDDPLVADKVYFTNPPFTQGIGHEPRYEVLEGWIRDESLKETEYEQPVRYVDALGHQYVVNQRFTRIEPMYSTGWRHVQVCGRVTLVDEESPFDFLPVVSVIDEQVPDEFWGQGECQTLQSLQFELNKRRSQMTDHATLNGGTVWLVDKAAQVTDEMLCNRPAQIIRYRKVTGQEIKREPGVPMPAFYMTMVEITIRDMREIAGVPAVAGGAHPKGARSGAAVEAAAANAQQRIRMRVRNLETSLKDLGRKMIKLVQRFDTEPRWIRVTGSYGYQGHIPFDGRHVRGDWDLSIVPGSTMNANKEAQQQLYLELYDKKIIDQQAVLEKFQIHGWQEILKRMQHYQVQMAPYYDGWPGQPSADPNSPGSPSERSGYSRAVRGMGMSQESPPPPPPAGQVPGPPQAAPPIGGNPHFAPQGQRAA